MYIYIICLFIHLFICVLLIEKNTYPIYYYIFYFIFKIQKKLYYWNNSSFSNINSINKLYK